MAQSLIERMIPLWRDYNYTLLKLERMKMKKLEEAIKTLQEELAKDKSEGSYYYSWQANIAMQFQDEYSRTFQKSLEEDKPELMSIHSISNQAAKNFLDLLIKQ